MTKQGHRILIVLGAVFSGLTLSTHAVDCPIGWAAVNALEQNGTTGGGNGAIVHVSTKTAFVTYAGSATPYTIIVDSTTDGSWNTATAVSVASHKTIIGAGADVIFNGFGLDISGRSNIILRNLTITNATPDAIAFRDSHHIWVDHCDLSASFDGLLDITVGSDYATVSWTKFHHHDKVSLANGGTQHFEDIGKERVTYHHNWYFQNVQRNPRIGYGKCHVFNNYFTNITSYCVGFHSQASVLVESNYFLNSATPLQQSYSGNSWDAAYADAKSVGNVFVNCSGTTNGTGISFDPENFYSYKFALDTATNAQIGVKASAGSMANGAANLICPVPASGAVDVVAETNALTWTAIEGATSWDVYFGTNSPPSLITNLILREFNPGSLIANTDYFWKVVANKPGGTVVSDIWRFHTAPTNASKPFPADGELHAPLRVNDAPTTTKPLELAWTPGISAVSNRVYLGTNAALAAGDFCGSVASGSFAPGQLRYGVTNYWRVDTVKTGGIIVTGAVWKFVSDVTNAAAGRTEAENMVRGGTYYRNNGYATASGGWVVRLEGGTGTASPGSLSSIWNGTNSTCHVNMIYYDESDGNGWFGLYINGSKISEWFASANDEKFHTNVTANVTLNKGDEIRIASYSDLGELNGVDAMDVEVLPSGPSAPGVPTSLVAASGDAQVMVAWGIPSGGTGYIVKRSMTNGGPYAVIANTTSTSYLDIGLTNGKTYYYVVSATNNAGTSANSAQVGATPSAGTNSVLIAYEGFNYTSGTSISLQSGGKGWGTIWQNFNPGSYIATNVSATLNFGALVVTNGALEVGYHQPGVPTDNTTATPQRVLPATLGTLAATNNNVLWLSFLLYNPQYPTQTGKFYRQSNLGFFSGAAGTNSGGSEVAAIGSPNTSATVTTNFGIWGGTVLNSAPIISTIPSFSDKVRLVVIKLVVDNTAAADNCYAWFNLNPALLGNNAGTPNALTADLSFNAADFSAVNAFRIQAGNFNSTGTNAFWTADELRLGTSFASVTPVSNFTPTLAAISNRTINVGLNLLLTNVAADIDTPAQTLTYHLPTKPTNASIGATSGVINWRPLVTQANSTNLFTIVVTDNGSPSLSVTQSFNVIVNPLPAPVVVAPVWNAGLMGFTVSGQVGPDYAVQASSDLVDWKTLLITNPARMPFTWSTNAGGLPAQYYRIQVGPPLP